NGTRRPSPPGATGCCSCPIASAPWPTWTSASSTTRGATSCPSVTTSTTGGAMPATTTCSPPKCGSRASGRVSTAKCPRARWSSLAAREVKTVLLSWSGSMFEYLMPMLVMPSYENTLLDETMRGAVERQVRYGRQRGVPWGISESGYHATDAHLNYQYRAFGVPGLGLKRGLAADLVVAPYATVMALMVDPKAAVLNLERLGGEGLASPYGFYEAIDYTPPRLPRGASSAVVRSHMVHHQGMALL